MSREQWLLERHNGIGASDIGGILGLSPFANKTPMAIFIEKTNEAPTEIPQTEKMKFGLKMEQVVADEYMERTGRKVIRDNKIRVHSKYPWLRCNLDRVIVDNGDGNGTGVCEIKTVSSFARKQWTAAIPLEYYAQVQQQLACTGYKWGVIPLLEDGNHYDSLTFFRDEPFIAEMIQKAEAFWNAVLNNDAEAIKLFPTDLDKIQEKPGSYVEATGNGVELVDAYLNLSKKKSEIEKDIKAASEAIKLLIGKNEGMKIGETVLVTYKLVTVEAYSVVAKSYRKLSFKKGAK